LDILVTPTVRALAIKKLNDVYYRFLPPEMPNYTLLYYNARSSGSKLDLHIDSHIPFTGSRTIMMQFVFLLEDADESNGCTVVVPGSHKSAEYTDRELDKVYPLAGKAGDLICWDSRLWHGTRENTSKRSRWALIATLGMWWIKPSMDIVRSVDDKIYRGCSNEQKQLLGFCSIPPVSPLERVNTKCGYEFLKTSVKEYDLK
jgi:ectoine hydroxylase-related dioxygenase (phytanoyl-CoA dioxygenase family)